LDQALAHQFLKDLFLRFFLILCFPLVFTGCFYNFQVEKSPPPKVDLKDYQPIAIFPVQNAPGYPESGANLSLWISALLSQKGYILIGSQEVSQTLEKLGLSTRQASMDPASLDRVNESLQAKLFLLPTILDYRLQKSSVGSKTFQQWDGATYETGALPTFYQGTFQLRVLLKLLDPRNGSVIWTIEGKVQGPSSAAESLGKNLVERLLEEIPVIASSPEPVK
jgi:hypothetical protein